MKMNSQKGKRNYYQSSGNNYRMRKQFILEPGIKGFLCTCNFREKDCVKDAYKILNEFAEELYDTDVTKDSDNDNVNMPKTEHDNSVDQTKHNDDEDDISTSLNKEINELKAEYSKPLTARRFQVVETGVKNIVFIRSTLANPLELVTRIITELDKTKQQRTRFLLRLLPIEIVCKANMNDIKLKANIMLEKYFAQEPKTFSIVFNRHSNHNINREEIIEDIAEIINKKNPGNKANLKNPELAVIVEIIRGFCLLSVAPNYYKFKKYNLLEICHVKEVTNNSKEASTVESTDSDMTEQESKETIEETCNN